MFGALPNCALEENQPIKVPARMDVPIDHDWRSVSADCSIARHFPHIQCSLWGQLIWVADTSQYGLRPTGGGAAGKPPHRAFLHSPIHSHACH